MPDFLAIFVATDSSRDRSNWGALSPDQAAQKRADPACVSDGANTIAAYTIVRAESNEAAARLFENHPHFTIPPGEAVEGMPCLPIPAG